MVYGLVVCCHAPSKKPEAVPLYHRKINADFQDYSCVIRETHYYLHRGETDIESEFRFPSKSYSIFNLRYRVEDGDWIAMQVKEKEEAQKEYTDAVNRGHQAFLAQENQEKLYSIKIGRLRKNERVVLEFSYYALLDVSEKSLNFRVPITMVPPYVRDATGAGVDTSALPKFEWDNLPYGIKFTGSVRRAAADSAFTVKVCERSVDSYTSAEQRVEIPQRELDGKRDLLIQVVPNEPIRSSCTVYTNESGEKYAQAVFANYGTVSELNRDATEKPRRFVFVIDGSGSMGGEAIEHARKAIKIAMQELPDCEYCLAMFGSNYRFYPDGPDRPEVRNKVVHTRVVCDGCDQYPLTGVRYKCKQCPDYDLCGRCHANRVHNHHTFDLMGDPEGPESLERAEQDRLWLKYTEDNRTATHKWIDTNVNANYGGTEMLNVLEAAYGRLSPRKKEYRNYLFFLTDGGVWGGDQGSRIHDIVKRYRDDVQVFTLGIGNGHAEELLDKMAYEGGGLARHVYKDSMLEETVQLLLKAVMRPNVRNVKVVWENCDVEHTAIKERDVLFHEEPYAVFAKVNNMNEGATVRLMSGERDVMGVSLLMSSDSFPSLLDRSYAVGQIEQLVKYPDLFKGEKTERVKRVTELGVKYQIVTPYTAAVAVRELENADGSKRLEKVEVPISKPEEFGQQVVQGGPESACFSMGPCGVRGHPGLSAACAIGYSNSIQPQSAMLSCASAPVMRGGGAPVAKGGPRSKGFTVMTGKHGLRKTIPLSMDAGDRRMMDTRSGDEVLLMDNAREESEDEDMGFGDDFGGFGGYSGGGGTLRNANMQLRSDPPVPTNFFGTAPARDPVVEILNDLILLQKIDGSWSVSDKLMGLMGLTDQKMTPEKVKAVKELKDANWVTLVVLAYFWKYMDQRNRWSRSFEKAEAYLNSHNSSGFENRVMELSAELF